MTSKETTMQVACPIGPSTLSEEEERTRGLLDAVFHVFVEVDASGLITDWNGEAESAFGWTGPQVLGRSFSEALVAPSGRAGYEEALKIFFGPEGPTQVERLETTVVHRDGHEVPIELAVFPTLYGETQRMAAFVRDLGPQEQVSEESEVEKRYRALMDQLAESYFEIDLRGKFTFTNECYREIYGIADSSRRVGASYKQFFNPQEAATVRDLYHNIYVTGRPARIELPGALSREGVPVFNEHSVSLKRDADGKAVGFAIIARDCTQRKKNEIASAQAKAAAEAAAKAKAQFLASMSHEIRTPLNGVIGALELASYTERTPEQQELLNLAQTSASHLLAVINAILDFSKIEAGKLELDCTQFHLEQTVAEVLKDLAALARQKGLELAYEISADVPHILVGDPTRLKQVLGEIAGNAIKFTERGEVVLRVSAAGSVAAIGEKAQLTFSISDTGIGIAVEKQKLIFEPFSQADTSATRKYGGAGLGLAICGSLVKLMGGSIGVEAELGKGSTLYFTIGLEVSPVAGGQAAGPQAGPPGIRVVMSDAGTNSWAPKEAHRGPGPLRILVAEDNPVTQKLAARLLEKLGHQAIVVDDGATVLAKLEEQSFDLVLMDIEMPVMNGFATTAAIRSKEQKTGLHLPIIAMTAHASIESRARCLEASFDDYIAKPVSGNQLQDCISRVLQSQAVQ